MLGVPVMAKKTFIQTEKDIGEFWHRRLTDAMVEAGREEKRLAEEKGELHEGVPAITVILGVSVPITTPTMPNRE